MVRDGPLLPGMIELGRIALAPHSRSGVLIKVGASGNSITSVPVLGAAAVILYCQLATSMLTVHLVKLNFSSQPMYYIT